MCKRVFDYFADKLWESIADRLQDKDLWKETINPLIDAIIDRQIARFQGKAGQMVKTTMPKFGVNDIIGLLIQRFLGNIGQPFQQQPLNSSSGNVLTEAKY